MGWVGSLASCSYWAYHDGHAHLLQFAVHGGVVDDLVCHVDLPEGIMHLEKEGKGAI